jgi:hypothetical protein
MLTGGIFGSPLIAVYYYNIVDTVSRVFRLHQTVEAPTSVCYSPFDPVL